MEASLFAATVLLYMDTIHVYFLDDEPFTQAQTTVCVLYAEKRQCRKTDIMGLVCINHSNAHNILTEVIQSFYWKRSKWKHCWFAKLWTRARRSPSVLSSSCCSLSHPPDVLWPACCHTTELPDRPPAPARCSKWFGGSQLFKWYRGTSTKKLLRLEVPLKNSPTA